MGFISLFMESTRVRSQMDRWLSYLKWYVTLVQDSIHGVPVIELIERALTRGGNTNAVLIPKGFVFPDLRLG